MVLKKTIRYLAFSLVPLFVIVLVLEFGLRAYFYVKQGGYRYRIERLVETKSAGPYYEEDSKIANELGFSGKGKFDPAKRRDEYRILVLGGSGAAGTRECSWPDEMGKELNKKDLPGRVRVLNGGIGGHTSSGEKKFMTRWMKLKPDLVIVYDGWNDMYYSRYLPEEYEEEFRIANTYYYPDLGERIEDFLVEHSILVRKVKALRRRMKTARKKREEAAKVKKEQYDGPEGVVVPVALNRPERKQEDTGYEKGSPFDIRLNWREGMKIKKIYPDENIEDNMSDIYTTNLREMADLARKSGAKVIFIVQPDLLYHYSRDPGIFAGEDEEVLSAIKHEGLREDWINTTRVLYPKVYEAMVTVAGEKQNVIGVYRIDEVFDEVPGKASLWSDSCHQVPEGRVIIGKHIADIVYDEVFSGEDKE